MAPARRRQGCVSAFLALALVVAPMCVGAASAVEVGSEWGRQTVNSRDSYYGYAAAMIRESCESGVEDVVVVAGGWSWEMSARHDVWRSGATTLMWQQVASSPLWQARGGHGMVALSNGTLVLFGGASSPSTVWTTRFYSDVWVSHDKGSTWSSRPDAPWSPRDQFAAVVTPDDKVVLMGGRTSDNPSAEVWHSADAGTSWSLVSSSPGWQPRYGMAVDIMPGTSTILLVGGRGTSDGYSGVWRNNAAGVGNWTAVVAEGSAPWTSHYAGALVALVSGEVLLLGGQRPHHAHTYVWRAQCLTGGCANWTVRDAPTWSPRAALQAWAAPGAASLGMPWCRSGNGTVVVVSQGTQVQGPWWMGAAVGEWVTSGAAAGAPCQHDSVCATGACGSGCCVSGDGVNLAGGSLDGCATCAADRTGHCGSCAAGYFFYRQECFPNRNDRPAGATCDIGAHCASGICPFPPGTSTYVPTVSHESDARRCCVPAAGDGCDHCGSHGQCVECGVGCAECISCELRFSDDIAANNGSNVRSHPACAGVNSTFAVLHASCVECRRGYLSSVSEGGMTMCAPVLDVVGGLVAIIIAAVPTSIGLWLAGRRSYDRPVVAAISVGATIAAVVKAVLAFLGVLLSLSDVISDLALLAALAVRAQDAEAWYLGMALIVLVLGGVRLVAMTDKVAWFGRSSYTDDSTRVRHMKFLGASMFVWGVLNIVWIGEIAFRPDDTSDGTFWALYVVYLVAMLATAWFLWGRAWVRSFAVQWQPVYSIVTLCGIKCGCRHRRQAAAGAAGDAATTTAASAPLWLYKAPSKHAPRSGWQDILVMLKPSLETTIMNWLEDIAQGFVVQLVVASAAAERTMSSLEVVTMFLTALSLAKGTRLVLFVPTSVLVYVGAFLLAISDVMLLQGSYALHAHAVADLLKDTGDADDGGVSQLPALRTVFGMVLVPLILWPTSMVPDGFCFPSHIVFPARNAPKVADITCGSFFKLVGYLIAMAIVIGICIGTIVLGSFVIFLSCLCATPVAIYVTAWRSRAEEQSGVLLEDHWGVVRRCLLRHRGFLIAAALATAVQLGLAIWQSLTAMDNDAFASDSPAAVFAAGHLGFLAAGVVVTAIGVVLDMRSKPAKGTVTPTSTVTVSPPASDPPSEAAP